MVARLRKRGGKRWAFASIQGTMKKAVEVLSAKKWNSMDTFSRQNR